MRTSAMWMCFALLGLVPATGCSSMKELGKEAQSGLEQAKDIKGSVDAIKKGDMSAAGDVALVSAVKGALTKNDKTRAAAIEVEAKGGVVTLKGKVAADIAAEAEKTAKGVPGVSKVESELDGKAHKDSKDKKLDGAKDGHDRDAKDAKDSKDSNERKAPDSKDLKDSKQRRP
jgi:hypothetical protein